MRTMIGRQSKHSKFVSRYGNIKRKLYMKVLVIPNYTNFDK